MDKRFEILFGEFMVLEAMMKREKRFNVLKDFMRAKRLLAKCMAECKQLPVKKAEVKLSLQQKQKFLDIVSVALYHGERGMYESRPKTVRLNG